MASQPSPELAVDCDQVDFTEVEEAGIELITQVNDMVQNIDLSAIQFDAYKLVESAQKIGMSEEDIAMGLSSCDG